MLLQREENEHKKQHEETKVWINYLSLIHSRPLHNDAPFDIKQERKKFIESIQPKVTEPVSTKNYEWDFELMDRLQSMQEGGG